MTRNSSAATAAQNSEASSARPAAAGQPADDKSPSRPAMGTTNRVRFSRKNAVHGSWSRSAALNAATSDPVSQRITLTRRRRRDHDRCRSRYLS